MGELLRELVRRNPVEWTGGPTPPPIKSERGPLVPPGDTEGDVYLWLVRQASLRLAAVQSHILTKKPTVSELAYRFTAERATIKAWINKTKAKAAKISKKEGVSFKTAVRRLDVPQPKRFSQRDLEIPKGVIFFASGAEGSPGDIEGVARIADRHPGVGVGIEISSCDRACDQALGYVAARRDVPLFVDSGAFGEFTRGIPITDDEWVERLGRYRALAAKFGARANLVAPDKIGSQAVTAKRLHDFAPLLVPAAKRGAWILLAAQKGRGRPRHIFWEDMRELLADMGIPRRKVVAALPMKEKGLTLPEVRAFAEHFGKDAGRYHLLGMSPLNRSPGFRRTLEAIWEWNPRATITCDASTIVKGLRGDPVLLGVVPRAYTHAQDIVRYDLMLEAFQRSYRGGESMEGWLESGWGQKLVPEYHDEMIYVDDWLPRRYRIILAERLARRSRERGDPLYKLFGGREHKALVKSPGEFLGSAIWEEPSGNRFLWWEDPEIEAWMDDQWVRYMGTYFTHRIKRDALGMAWRARELAITELAFG